MLRAMASHLNWGDRRLPERFWNKVQPCPMSGCWLWTGGVKFYPDSSRRHFGLTPRRAIFEAMHGPIRSGRRLRARCGIDECCNPAHFRRATNFKDAAEAAAYSRRWRLRNSYGISVEQFDRMFSVQGGRCAICLGAFTSDHNGKPRVDHCHASGRVRGLLCLNCNAGLGSFGDNVATLLRAAEYASLHNGTDPEGQD